MTLVQIIIIVSCTRHDIQIAIVHVDAVITKLIHFTRVRVTRIPEIHLHAVYGDRCRAAVLGLAAEYARSISHLITDKLEQFILILTECFLVAIFVLIGANMHDSAFREYRIITGQIFRKYALDKFDRFRIFDIKIFIAVGTSQIRSCADKCTRVSWRIEFRCDIHADLAAVQDKGTELIFRIIVIRAGQVRHIGLQTESGIIRGLAILELAEAVVIQMYMEIVQLIPGHRLDQIFQEIQMERASCDIQHEAAHFIFRVILGDSLIDGGASLLQDLQDRPRGPVCSCRFCGLYFDKVHDFHHIRLFVQCLITESKVEIARCRIAAADHFDVSSHDIFVVCRKDLSGLHKCGRRRIDNDLAGIVHAELALIAEPLLQFRQYGRFFIDRIRSIMDARNIYGNGR